MSVILIPTYVEDVHAYATAIVLEEMGHRALLWHCSDMPEREAASIHLAPGSAMRLSLHGRKTEMPLESVDVFWNRRIGPPVVTTQLLDCDHEIAVHENQRFVRSLLASITRDRFAVNGFDAARRAEDKVLQLATAQRLGFDLPATLVSNDPTAIHAFVAQHEDRGAIVKSFSPMGWHGASGVVMNFTASVSSGMLPRDQILRLTPAIYQTYIPKAYEVRVTCMGHELVAAALHSQRDEQARVDWRTVLPKTLDIERIPVPTLIAQQCQTFMKDLDLHFGCFDFIVTPDGRWVFLEMNQMGQFLWVEEANAEFPLLQMFCDFLVSKDAAFRHAPRRGARGYAEVVAQACARMEEAARFHLQPAAPNHIHVEPGGPVGAVSLPVAP